MKFMKKRLKDIINVYFAKIAEKKKYINSLIQVFIIIYLNIIMKSLEKILKNSNHIKKLNNFFLFNFNKK